MKKYKHNGIYGNDIGDACNFVYSACATIAQNSPGCITTIRKISISILDPFDNIYNKLFLRINLQQFSSSLRRNIRSAYITTTAEGANH